MDVDAGAMATAERMTNDVLVALRRIIRAIDLRSRHLVNFCGLTGPQLVVLKELAEHDGISVGELTRAIHLSQATVTGILDRLARRHLIQRERSDQDKRRVRVHLTAKAKELLLDAPPLLQEDFTDQFRDLEDWEQTQILSSLQRVVAMLEARKIDATPILATGPIAAADEETEAFLDKSAGRKEDGLTGDSRAAQPPERAVSEP